jgi:flagellar motility protein MotE (MotC chaperone)
VRLIGGKELETLGDLMATTFLKRQKEMKRQEKQREKAERRKQKKLAKLAESVNSLESTDAVGDFNELSTPRLEK